MRRSLYAAVVAIALLVGVVPASGASSRMVARYDFDGGSAVADDTGNGHTLGLVARRGGQPRWIKRGNGRAVQFPGKCAGRKCPHAVLQTPNRADLNPGTRPLLFGATVRLTATETSKGQNVVQKGYSARGSQYKLQIDGVMGRPSCALVGAGGRGIHIVRSAVSVTDGQWHTLACRRVGSVYTVLIDGAVRGIAQIPPGLSIINKAPLSIGGKGAYADNDQFNGALDDVWVQIG